MYDIFKLSHKDSFFTTTLSRFIITSVKITLEMNCETHNWVKDNVLYICETCGMTTLVKPDDYIEQEDDTETETLEEEKCWHVWECLKDRCHNRGKGKYQAYKCKLCGKFQRR